MKRAVAVVSGGMDSVTMAYQLRDEGYSLRLLSVDYGQRHRRELDFAQRAALALGAEHDIIKLPVLGAIGASALTDPAIPVPHGHYAAESMKATIVPNRNMVLLSIAGAFAVKDQADVIATGVHAGDHAIYPDCRPEFLQALATALRVGNEGFLPPHFGIYAPFIGRTKADIAAKGSRLNVPFELTWSCYEGGEVHCGQCGTCVERIEAFRDAGVTDPTVYAA